MPQIPHELIRQVQIQTRAAAGLPDFDPSDPTLPALPPLSAAIAAAADAADASAAERRCRNCKALLLRGSDSIVCLYCGVGPHYDAVPESISFTSTAGYQWLLRSLRLDGSEMVDPTSKLNQGKVQSSPKDLTSLSAFLNFKIQWPAENVNEEISSDKPLEEGKRSSILPGVAPDKFFLTPKSDVVSESPTQQPSDFKWVEADSPKDVAALGDRDLFQNVQSSKPAVSFSEPTPSSGVTGWGADFQFPDSENQLAGHTSSGHVVASSQGSEIKFDDPESFQSSSNLNVDLGAQLDSVFGPGENVNDGKVKDGPSVPTAAGAWDSDDIWNNLGSSTPDLSGGFDAAFSTKIDPQNDDTKDASTSVDFDLFPDFSSQTNSADVTKNKAADEEQTATDEDVFEDWNDFASSTTGLQAPSQNVWAGSSDHVSTSENKPSGGDLFSFDSDNKLAGDNKSSDIDIFSFDSDNKLAGDNKSSDIDIFSFDNKFEDDKKPPQQGDIFSFDSKYGDGKKPLGGDLFSFDNKFEDDKKAPERDLFSFDGDFGGALFSTSTSSANAPAEGNAIMSDDPASIWFNDVSGPSLEAVQAAKNDDAFGQSSKDGVKTLISQMHDLSFMLETDLSVPSGSDDHKPVRED